jgi:hypothetical protein
MKALPSLLVPNPLDPTDCLRWKREAPGEIGGDRNEKTRNRTKSMLLYKRNGQSSIVQHSWLAQLGRTGLWVGITGASTQSGRRRVLKNGARREIFESR